MEMILIERTKRINQNEISLFSSLLLVSCGGSGGSDDNEDLFNLLLFQNLLTPSSACITGQNWTAFTGPGVSNAWESVAYGNGTYVAVSSTGTNRVMTSTDGQNWTVRPSSNDNNEWFDVTFGNGKFVAVATNGTNLVMTSTDGISWTGFPATSELALDAWQTVMFGGGRFIAINASSTTHRFMVSTDGETWTNVAYAPDVGYVIHDGNRYLGFTRSGNNRIKTSTDGINWTDFGTYDENLSSSDTIPIRSAIFALNRYNLTTSRNRYVSTNLESWESVGGNPLGGKAAFGNGVLVGVQDKETFSLLRDIGIRVITSYAPNARGFSVQQIPPFDSGKTSIAYGDKQFVIVAKEGSQRILRSNPCP